MTYELAQVNISRLVAPVDDSRLRGFGRAFGPITAAGSRAPGFVWRWPAEEARDGSGFADDVGGGAGIITNLTVWTDVESLVEFVHGRVHGPLFRRTPEWFLPMTEASTACWWVKRGARPTISDAEERLAHLRVHGPTVYAFPLDEPFDPPAL